MNFTAHATPDGVGWRLKGTIALPQPNSGAGFAAWLRALDPEEVQRVALERCTGLAGSGTADIIEVLAEWAEGSV